MQGGIPVVSLGQLGVEFVIEGVQFGGMHRLLKQLLLHLLLQLLQCCDLHCILGSSVSLVKGRVSRGQPYGMLHNRSHAGTFRGEVMWGPS